MTERKDADMENRVCKVLGIEKPIIQGPALWLTNAEFVAACSNAGILGVIGLNAGETEFVYTVEETMERTRNVIRKTKALTDKPFALNVGPVDPVEDVFTEATIQLMVEEGVSIALYWGSVIPYWFDRFHENGIKVIYRADTPSVENTRAAVAAGADVIAATGFDEGGTLPVRVVGTFSVVPMVVDAAEGKVPVVACGGIADERTAKAAFALGAEGVLVGTAFLLSKESIVAENIKQQALTLNADDMLMYRVLPAFYRTVPGELPDKLVRMSKEGASEAEIFDAQNRYTGMRDGMLYGDLSKGFASFGLGISMIHEIQSVAEIVDRLMKGIREPL